MRLLCVRYKILSLKLRFLAYTKTTHPASRTTIVETRKGIKSGLSLMPCFLLHFIYFTSHKEDPAQLYNVLRERKTKLKTILFSVYVELMNLAQEDMKRDKERGGFK